MNKLQRQPICNYVSNLKLLTPTSIFSEFPFLVSACYIVLMIRIGHCQRPHPPQQTRPRREYKPYYFTIKLLKFSSSPIPSIFQNFYFRQD